MAKGAKGSRYNRQDAEFEVAMASKRKGESGNARMKRVEKNFVPRSDGKGFNIRGAKAYGKGGQYEHTLSNEENE